MHKFNVGRAMIFMFVMAISFSSCAAIEGIFKAGVWVGVIAVIVVIAVIFWIISKIAKK